MVVEVEKTSRVPDRHVHGTLPVQSLYEESGCLRSPSCESGMTSHLHQRLSEAGARISNM